VIIPDNWLPTADNVNALPRPLRVYIHDLETKCDPSGDIQSIASLTDQRDGLVARVKELEAKHGPEVGAFRPGIPSVEDVRAHEDRGRCWVANNSSSYPIMFLLWVQGGKVYGEHGKEIGIVPDSRNEDGTLFRPVDDEGHTVPWPDEDADGAPEPVEADALPADHRQEFMDKFNAFIKRREVLSGRIPLFTTPSAHARACPNLARITRVETICYEGQPGSTTFRIEATLEGNAPELHSFVADAGKAGAVRLVIEEPSDAG